MVPGSSFACPGYVRLAYCVSYETIVNSLPKFQELDVYKRQYMKSSNIGGQAVLEGIMMKHNEEYAVAVRKPDGEISVKKEKYHSIVKWKVLTTTPFIRGVFNFIDSMVCLLYTSRCV